MLLLSARAFSETAKRNSVCFEIPFDRSSFLIETSQLICVANRLTAFFVMRAVRGFHLTSGWGVFLWAHGFCRLFGELPVNLQRLRFRLEFSRQKVGWDFCILRGVISKQIIVLFFFVAFELALSR